MLEGMRCFSRVVEAGGFAAFEADFHAGQALGDIAPVASG